MSVVEKLSVFRSRQPSWVALVRPRLCGCPGASSPAEHSGGAGAACPAPGWGMAATRLWQRFHGCSGLLFVSQLKKKK